MADVTFAAARQRHASNLDEAYYALSELVGDPTTCNPSWPTLVKARERLDDVLSAMLRLNNAEQEACR